MAIDEIFDLFYKFVRILFVCTFFPGLVIFVAKFILKNFFPDFYNRVKYFEFKVSRPENKSPDINSEEHKMKLEKFKLNIELQERREREKLVRDEIEKQERFEKIQSFKSEISVEVLAKNEKLPINMFLYFKKGSSLRGLEDVTNSSSISWLMTDDEYNVLEMKSFIVQPLKIDQSDELHDVKYFRWNSFPQISHLLRSRFSAVDKIYFYEEDQFNLLVREYVENELDFTLFKGKGVLFVKEYFISSEIKLENYDIDTLAVSFFGGGLSQIDLQSVIKDNTEQKLMSYFNVYLKYLKSGFQNSDQ